MKTKSIIFLLFLFVPASFMFAQIKRLEAVKQESFITYKITHPLHEIESTSKMALCLVDVDMKTKEIKKVLVQVAVTSFNSGNSNRDSHAMEVVEALLYPDTRFISSSVTQKGDSLQVSGKLTFHGVTKDVYMTAVDQWSGNKLIVTGGFNISLTAFKVKRPSLFMIPVSDTLVFTFKQVFNVPS
ncbi:MAG TPA: YceI family protein [Ignavibacteriaceae bacterium]|nr:YceI family protein [Ignavibacteriaceae bacterium]